MIKELPRWTSKEINYNLSISYLSIRKKYEEINLLGGKELRIAYFIYSLTIWLLTVI